MTISEYCCRVQLLLLDADVPQGDEMLHACDRGRVSTAVRLSLEGDDVRALELAEDVADRWLLDVSDAPRSTSGSDGRRSR